MIQAKETVYVGLSGGVDSSVAALRLLRQGYDVVGVFIKVWQPDFIDCKWEEERLDAMRVAAHLNIPFVTFDAEKAYKQSVADYFIAEYQAGRTPNPDVLCNKSVKFGVFYDFAMSMGATYVATGHYAQIKQSEIGDKTLVKGIDTAKDQTYFLWMLRREQLKRVLFPVGNSTKDQIRIEAKEANIPVALKKDSQGVCFLGHIDIPNFLAHFMDVKPGVVLDASGNKIGTHKGAIVYTLGQRHGFDITVRQTTQAPQYVIDTDLIRNTVTVSPEKPTMQRRELLRLESVNLLVKDLEKHADTLHVQTRYRQLPLPARVVRYQENNLELEIKCVHDAAASGQSCVLYAGENCLGGGIIL